MHQRRSSKIGQDNPRHLEDRAQAQAQSETLRIERIASYLRLWSEPTRLRIALTILTARQPSLNVTALCEATGYPQPTVSHHLALLQSGNAVTRHRSGKKVYYTLSEHTRTILNALLDMSQGSQGT